MKNQKARAFDGWLRKQNLTTQTFVALATDLTGSSVSYSTVSKWRCGMTSPQPFTADVLAKKFPTCPLFKR